MSVTASAPGKLILIGEYAVIGGAPALVMAVNRRALVRAEPGAPNAFSALGKAPAAFRYDGDQPVFEGPDTAHLSLARTLLGQTRFEGAIDADSAAFASGQEKLGLGSSAAVTVAALAAMLNTTDVESQAHQTHRTFQSGRGSGADIASSVHGGLLEYRRDTPVTPLDWPDQLIVQPVWTGRGAKTTDFLTALEAQPNRSEPVLAEMQQLSGLAGQALRRDVGRFLELVTSYRLAMEALGTAIRSPVVSEAHQQASRVCEQFDLAYKPSGAGGGDFGLIFSIDEDAIKACRLALLTKGFKTPDLAIDREGVRLEADSKP